MSSRLTPECFVHAHTLMIGAPRRGGSKSLVTTDLRFGGLTSGSASLSDGLRGSFLGRTRPLLARALSSARSNRRSAHKGMAFRVGLLGSFGG